MKYAIIIPSYQEHLKQVELFLSSFNDNAMDKLEIPIKLIVSENEILIFNNMIKKYNLNIEIITLKKIINSIEGIDINENELLNKIQKFNFQSIKKLYGVKFFNADLSLVLDSEALLIRQVEFKTIFENYKKNKIIFYSKHHKKDPLQLQVTNNIFKILNEPFHDMWFFDYQYWFFENAIINDLFDLFKKNSLFNILNDINPIFEYNLYSAFIFLQKKYNYEFVNVDFLLENKMGKDNYLKYINNLKSGTAFEYLSWHLTDNNFNIFNDIFKNYNLLFFKYDDRFLSNEKIQRKFIEENKQISLLVCRVVCEEFVIDNFKIPINHDYKNNRPIL